MITRHAKGSGSQRCEKGSSRVGRSGSDDQVDRAAERMIGSLKRSRKTGGKTITRLIDRLQHCTVGKFCNSGCCPRCCVQNFAPTKAAIQLKLRKSGCDEQFPVMVTVVLASVSAPVGKLSQLNLTNVKRRLKRRLKSGGLTWCVGALDFSVNEHEGGAYDPHWSVHLHAFSVVANPKQTSRRLSRALLRSSAVQRPVKVQVWDGRQRAMDYAFKTYAEGRVGREQATHFRRSKPTQAIAPWPKTRRLRAAEWHELLLLLDKSGPLGRLFQFGAALRGGRIQVCVRA